MHFSLPGFELNGLHFQQRGLLFHFFSLLARLHQQVLRVQRTRDDLQAHRQYGQQLINQLAPGCIQRFGHRQLEHPEQLLVVHERVQQHHSGPRLNQPAANLEMVRGHILQDDRAAFERTLADQALTELDARRRYGIHKRRVAAADTQRAGRIVPCQQQALPQLHQGRQR